MVDLQKLADKWQKKWVKDKIFEPEVTKSKKFFFTTPYPYISGSLHIGHGRAAVEGDVYVRYKRMQGFNTLFPLAFHITGTPVLGISAAIEKGDKKKIEIYKGYVKNYIKDKKELEKTVQSFKDPWNIVKFFIPKMMDEYAGLGLGIDWTRRFTTGDKDYQQFITWQFNKYKDKNYLIKGSYPVLFCPSCGNAVGEDDIQDADTNPVTKQDFIWGKFKLKDSDLILMAGTTRPDAFWGQTNLWLDPKGTYKIVKVKDEKWVVGEAAIDKIKHQYENPEVIGEIKASELYGKWVQGPLVDYEIPIIPAGFINAKVGSGIVYSALEDPVDLLELKKIQEDKELIKKYKLDPKMVAKLKPIFIINVPGMGENLGADIAKEYGIKSAKDVEKLEQAKGELNKRVFRKGVMKKNCGKYSGMTVKEALVHLKRDLIKSKESIMFYETSREAYCRCGGRVVVSVLRDQWFLDFNAEGWKDKAYKCLSKMELFPKQSRKQFEDAFDWLDKRPCARRRGIGTPLPFNKEWIIESLSDSTIYMSFYIIKKIINENKTKPEQLTPSFFDYVYLNEGDIEKVSKETKINKTVLKQLREEFDYWYPNDHRHTYTAHLSNHLSFFIFSHAGIFPEKYWPKKISLHGFVTSEGQKMSKSKGNVITLLDIKTNYSADVFRFYMTTSTTLDGAFNWRNEDATNVRKILNRTYETLDAAIKVKKKGKLPTNSLAFISKFERTIKEATTHLENMELREYGTSVVYGLLNELKRLQRKVSEEELAIVYDYILERWIKLLSPVVPHLSEELWKGKGYCSLAPWPKFDAKKIDAKAEFMDDIVSNLISDINEVKKLAKVEKPKEVKIIVSYNWKYDFIKKFKKTIEKTRNVGEIIKSLVDKEHGKDISKLVPMLVKNPQRVPETVLTQKEEVNAMKESIKQLEKEFNTTITLETAEKSTENKKNNAMPGKPAILLN